MDKTAQSRTLAFLLRHSEDCIDLNGGWASVEVILARMAEQFPGFSEKDLAEIVARDAKQRYAFDETGRKIRANQGHSVSGVVIEMERPQPPELLYHGTGRRFLDSILREGLRPMERQYVHLSTDEKTAKTVGGRHGAPVVLTVDAGRFVRDGHALLRSANGVWQAEYVAPEYLRYEEHGR